MASAATAKRRSGLNSGIGGRIKARAASRGGTSAASSGSDEEGESMQTSTTSDASRSDLSEKRRMAALISWEKRRKNSEKAAKARDAPASKRRSSGAATAPAKPPKGRGKKAMQKKSEPLAKKRRVDTVESKSKPLDRSEAAKLGWERRKNQLAAKDVRRQAAKVGWERRKSQQQQTAKDVRRQAAKVGWERRKKQMSAKDVRSEAARRGWERRKRMLASESSAVESSSDESSEDESSEEEPSAPAPDNSSSGGKKKSAAARRVYTAQMRAEAARRGWEKKKREAAARRASSGDASSDSAAPSKASSSTTTAASKPRVKKEPKETKQYREGTKRSRRLAEETSSDIYEEAKRVNEIVTRLRMRGWMEFHPSSRHGSGTANYGYIPSSIASFVRGGYVTQGDVLEHGELGIHYALDYEGYGGLKEMIDTFGEDFSPCLTDGMMDSTRIAEWELGEDLPWREVEEAENKLLKQREEEARQKIAIEAGSPAMNGDEDVDEDIFFVASILASLDRDVTSEQKSEECKQGDHPDCNEDASVTTTQDATALVSRSPSMLALKAYETSDESETQKENPLSRLADASLTKECQDECETPNEIVEEDVLIIQRPGFSQWNFGLC